MEKYSFFNSVSGDREYNASDFAEYFKQFLQSGIFPNPSTSLQVLANDNYVVSVQPGTAIVEGYMYYTDGKDLTLDVADGVLNRTDLMVVQLDIPNRKIETMVKKGVPATNPVPPLVERTDSIYELALAEIHIGKNAAGISQMNITDTRMDSSRAGWVNSTIQADTTAIFNQYENWYHTQREHHDQEWEDFMAQANEWFANVKQEDNPNKQNKITYGQGYELPNVAVDGDIHIANTGNGGIIDVLRYTEEVFTWEIITSNLTAYMRHQNPDTSVQMLSQIINELKEKANETPLVQAGNVSIVIPSTNTPITERVYFDKPFDNTPSIALLPVTSDPRVVNLSTTSVTETYFDLIIVRTNNTVTTSVQWTATERTQ